jgi:hypothetical protein
MKTIKKRTEITVKTYRLIVFNRPGGWVGECEMCGKEVEMVTPEEAAAIIQISSRAIYRAIEAGDVHFIEAPQVFMCRNSLFEFFSR